MSRDLRLGILGGGQLGRMLALAALPLGVRCTVLEPAENAPAAAVAVHLAAGYDDRAALQRLAAGAVAVTYEFENVPLAALERLQGQAVVRPGIASLRAAQDRLAEKATLRGTGIQTAPYAPVASAAEAHAAAASIGLPAILKTRRLGYDGRGQRRVTTAAELLAAWRELGEVPCILEGVVAFRRELATLVVRDPGGAVRAWPVVETRQAGGMLRRAVAPAPGLAPAVERLLLDAHVRLAAALEHIGVLAVEWFETADSVLANEIAPRVHNSGHWSIEGAVTSQFANHVRAVCGLPLGACDALLPSGTVNLVGELPDLDAVLRVEGASLHLYGKAPRPARKLGHVTVVGGDPAERDRRLAAVEALLPAPGTPSPGAGG